MKIDKNKCRLYITSLAKENRLRFEVHEFPSKAIMIDIWKGDDMLVTQIEDEKIGFSIISDDNSDISSTSDRYFFDFLIFKESFDKYFSKQ